MDKLRFRNTALVNTHLQNRSRYGLTAIMLESSWVSTLYAITKIWLRELCPPVVGCKSQKPRAPSWPETIPLRRESTRVRRPLRSVEMQSKS